MINHITNIINSGACVLAFDRVCSHFHVLTCCCVCSLAVVVVCRALCCAVMLYCAVSCGCMLLLSRWYPDLFEPSLYYTNPNTRQDVLDDSGYFGCGCRMFLHCSASITIYKRCKVSCAMCVQREHVGGGLTMLFCAAHQGNKRKFRCMLAANNKKWS